MAAFYPAFGPWMRRVLAAAPRCGRTRVDCPIPLRGCARAMIGPVRMRGQAWFSSSSLFTGPRRGEVCFWNAVCHVGMVGGGEWGGWEFPA